MSEFTTRYAALNAPQKQAVDAIDGPVMVVAGPGTGKTELLSVRVANILQRTDTLPGNILCLTFTDSAALNMRQRLTSLLGPDAYKVAVHTFHSFGSEVINTNGEYFYQGAHFRPADELSVYEILSSILGKLPHDNPLSSQLNGRYTYLRDIQATISELKRGGLTPDELEHILQRNAAFCEWLRPKLANAFNDRVSKKTYGLVRELVEAMRSYHEDAFELAVYHPLATLLQESLERALIDAEANNTTKTITAWKNAFLEKDAHGNWTLKDDKRGQKLRALQAVYDAYLVAMQEAQLYDYDDMILRVVHALEVFDELRFSLQEKYQYILVDEFQDTNDAQMRLIWNLTNNPASDGRPNLMVVGDDDQAIYRFQGADLSNILDFTNRYRDVTVITLTDNYRSAAPILDLARTVIVQATERLEHTLEGVSKVLTPHHTPKSAFVGAKQYETVSQSYAGLASAIATELQQFPDASHAVIARHHKELVALVPHLTAAGVAVHYERQENVLDSEPIRQLEACAHVVWHISRQEFDAANDHMPELLSHPAWGLAAKDLWNLSLTAHRQKKFWLEVMLEQDGQLRDIAEWLIVGSAHVTSQPLEYMLDYLFGVQGSEGGFYAPYKRYFFEDSEHISPAYLSHLSALQKIRSAVRDYRPGMQLRLDDFIEYLDISRDLELHLTANSTVATDTSAVTLLSAHKAKGLEFNNVYVTDVHDSVWGSSARSRRRLLNFPSNLALSPVGDSDDERLRLLYVALTRARDTLTLFAARTTESGKALVGVGAVPPSLFEQQSELPLEQAAATAEHEWFTPLLDVSHYDRKLLLAPLLERYKLSATHFNNFLNVTRGGPEYFLLHNLLRLPKAMPASAAYGSAIHGALQRAHQHFAATGKKRPVEDVLHDFAQLLQQTQMSHLDLEKFSSRGSKSLTAFLAQRYDSFSGKQLTERTFSNEYVAVNDAVLTGALDLIDIDHDEKTIFITDYKTGKAAKSWHGTTEYEKIKLHHYEQQLMFYKLLVEHSRQFSGYTVTGARLEFIEPDAKGDIVLLDYTYNQDKLRQFTTLVLEVWRRIQSLDFTQPDNYESSLGGIQRFEEDILQTTI